DELAIRRLFAAEHVIGGQPCAFEQFLQFAHRQRMLDIVDALVLHASFSQDPLDLAACASSRLFINCDRAFFLHVVCALIRSLDATNFTRSSPRPSRSSSLPRAVCRPREPSPEEAHARSEASACLGKSTGTAASRRVP